jgi:hypothetical protein
LIAYIVVGRLKHIFRSLVVDLVVTLIVYVKY